MIKEVLGLDSVNGESPDVHTCSHTTIMNRD